MYLAACWLDFRPLYLDTSFITPVTYVSGEWVREIWWDEWGAWSSYDIMKYPYLAKKDH